VAALTLAALLGGCAPAPHTLTVFAAASLTGTFTELARQFEAARPGVTVELNFAGSRALASQITEGAPAQVFASADLATMATLTDAGLIVGTPVTFATNTLEIVVPVDNPANITSFADLAAPSIFVVTCAPQVPCGAAVSVIERETGVELTPVSEENAVTDVLGKVLSGEADAGLVYTTDIAAAERTQVRGIRFDESALAVTSYPIGVVRGVATSESTAALAAEFARFITGPEARTVFRAASFGVPAR
jgi:molybdate transport system substrate-binding protein